MGLKVSYKAFLITPDNFKLMKMLPFSLNYNICLKSLFEFFPVDSLKSSETIILSIRRADNIQGYSK